MTNTIVVHNTTTAGRVLCRALCLESDVEELLKDQNEPYLFPSFQTMQEALFRIYHPNAYREYVEHNLVDCIGVWLEQFYEGDKDYTTDDDTIFTESYNILVGNGEVKITFYIGCDTIESAALILMLKDRFRSTEVIVNVSFTTTFARFCEN